MLKCTLFLACVTTAAMFSKVHLIVGTFFWTIEQQNKKKKYKRSLTENYRYQGGISCKDGHNQGQKGINIEEVDNIKKRWKECTEELYKNDHNDLD